MERFFIFAFIPPIIVFLFVGAVHTLVQHMIGWSFNWTLVWNGVTVLVWSYWALLFSLLLLHEIRKPTDK